MLPVPSSGRASPPCWNEMGWDRSSPTFFRSGPMKPTALKPSHPNPKNPSCSTRSSPFAAATRQRHITSHNRRAASRFAVPEHRNIFIIHRKINRAPGTIRREKTGGGTKMASLARAATVAVRSAARSAPLTGRVLGGPLPFPASPSAAARSARILRR